LAFAGDGTLYVATGDKGQIYAVAPDGKSELFYSSDEAHIRVLALTAGKFNCRDGAERARAAFDEKSIEACRE